MIRRPVFALEPRVEKLILNHGNYGLVLEPQYDNPAYTIPHFSLENMYFGDDYGGYNMDYPHPVPPQPSKRYQQDAFIDLAQIFPEYGPRPEPKQKKGREGGSLPDFNSMSNQYEQELFRGIGAGYKSGISDLEQPGKQTH